MPDTMRWSALSVSIRTCRATAAPSRSATRCTAAPTASVAAWPGWMIAVKACTPCMPRLETVNVAPDSAAAVIVASRTSATSAASCSETVAADLASASKIVGITSASPPPTTTPTLARS